MQVFIVDVKYSERLIRSNKLNHALTYSSSWVLRTCVYVLGTLTAPMYTPSASYLTKNLK